MFRADTVSPQFLRYLIVGGIGFIVDAGILEVLVAGGLSPYKARVLSMAVAILATYFLHRFFTFGQRGVESPAWQFAGFSGAQIFSGAVNYLFFSFVLGMVLPPPVSGVGRFFAIAVGTAAGLMLNYTLLRSVIFVNGKAGVKDLLAAALKRKTEITWVLVFFGCVLSSALYQKKILAWPALVVPLNPDETDSWVRLTQVRQWMTEGFSGKAGAFFDHGVRQAASGVDTPWTRPMDALLAGLAALMPSSYSIEQKLLLATAWLPPFLLLGAAFFLWLAVRSQYRHFSALVGVVFLMMASPITSNYFMPGYADHHGLLSMLWCAVLAVVVRAPLSARGGVLLGALLGLMFWISPEALALIGVVYALFGLYALMRPGEMRALAFSTLALSAVTAAGLLVEVGLDRFFSFTAYDTLSIVYVFIFTVIAVAAGVLHIVFSRGFGFAGRLMASAVIFAATLLSVHAAYPLVFLGPMAEVDPYILTDFLPRVSEAKPLFEGKPGRVFAVPYQFIFVLGLLCLATFMRSRHVRARAHASLAFILCATFALVVFQLRWGYYFFPVAVLGAVFTIPPVFVAARGRLLSWARYLPRCYRPYVGMWIFLMLGAIGVIAVGNIFNEKNIDGAPQAAGSCPQQLRYVTQTGQLKKLLGDRKHVVFSSNNLMGELLFFTPYRVLAGNYHREGVAMRARDDIIRAKSMKEARDLLRKSGVTAVFVCPSWYKDGIWLKKLQSPRTRPAWLQKVGKLDLVPTPEKEPSPVLLLIR